MSDADQTRRDSGTLNAFVDACQEALALVEGSRMNDEGLLLAHEARNLLTIFQAWTVLRPSPVDRATAIARALTLHGKAMDYAARNKRRRPV